MPTPRSSLLGLVQWADASICCLEECCEFLAERIVWELVEDELGGVGDGVLLLVDDVEGLLEVGDVGGEVVLFECFGVESGDGAVGCDGEGRGILCDAGACEEAGESADAAELVDDGFGIECGVGLKCDVSGEECAVVESAVVGDLDVVAGV